MKICLTIFLLSFAIFAKAQDIDQLYKKYSSTNYIFENRVEILQEDSNLRIDSILKHMASAHRAALKRDRSPDTRRAKEKRQEVTSLKELLNKISPIKKDR